MGRVVAGVVVVLVGCAGVLAAPGPGAEEAAIRQVLKDFDAAYQSRSLDALGELFSRGTDTVYFGPDVADRWVGWPAIRAGLGAEFRRVKSLEVTGQPATLHVRGSIAWFERLTVQNLVVEGGQTSLLARATGVLEKTGEKWRIVQYHASVGAQRDRSPDD